MTRRHLLYSILVTGVVFLSAWFFKDNFFTDGWLQGHQLLPMKNNSSLSPAYEKLLLLRREWKGGPLLLKVLNEEPVVRYHFDTERSDKVDLANWQSATEPITVCGGSFTTSSEEEVSKYHTYGKYALDGAFSPSGAKLAVVSAYGPKMPSFSFIPGLGGGRNIWGQRYLEAKNGQPPFENLRKPIRMEDDWSQSLCWTSEEDAIVYFSHHYFSRFSVFYLGDKAVLAKPDGDGQRLVPGPTPPDLSRLTGNFRDYGIDADGDGLYEKIAVEIETETIIPGKYKLLLSLASSQGKTVYRGADAELKGGMEWTKLLFDTEEWYEKGIDGPLEIVEAEIEYGTGIDVEKRDDLGRTQNYPRVRFKRENIIWTGEQAYKLVDPDKNGKFRALEFDVTVDILRPGEYRYQNDLYSERWTSTYEGMVDSGEGRVHLRKGTNELKLRFKGKNILKYGKAGKFQLKNLVLYEKGETGKIFNEFPLTRHFELSEFSPE